MTLKKPLQWPEERNTKKLFLAETQKQPAGYSHRSYGSRKLSFAFIWLHFAEAEGRLLLGSIG